MKEHKVVGDKIIDEYFKNIDKAEDDNLLTNLIRQAKDEYDLNKEMTKRVIEYVNVTVFLKLLKSTDDKTVHFDVAEPGKVFDEDNIVPIEDVEFDDDAYIIPDVEEETFKEERMVNPTELFELLDQLLEEKERLVYDKNRLEPKLVRGIKHYLRYATPNEVTYSLKTAGVKQEFIMDVLNKEGIDEVNEIKEKIAVDTSTPFLKQAESYGKMSSRIEDIEDKVEKIANILQKTMKSPFMKAFRGYQKANRAGPKAKQQRNNIMKNKKVETPGYGSVDLSTEQQGRV